jgi:hypothetical protein
MVEPRGPVQSGEGLRQHDVEPEGVVASRDLPETLAPLVPKGAHATGDGLDDEDGRAFGTRLQQATEKLRPFPGVELVDGERGDDTFSATAGRCRFQRLLVNGGAKAERREEASGLEGRPRIFLIADDGRDVTASRRPGGTGDAQPASEIEDPSRRWRLRPERPDHFGNDEEMEGAVETGEGRPFGGSVEDRAAVDSRALLDIDSRQSDHSLAELGEGQRSSVVALKRRDPVLVRHRPRL